MGCASSLPPLLELDVDGLLASSGAIGRPTYGFATKEVVHNVPGAGTVRRSVETPIVVPSLDTDSTSASETPKLRTLVEMWRRSVRLFSGHDFLGTRLTNSDGTFGAFEFFSYVRLRPSLFHPSTNL